MSFSTDIKNEVTRLDSSKEELISELSAIVRNSALIDKSITIYIENNSVARRIFKLFRNVYDITPIITVRKKYFSNGLSYILTIKHKKDEILDDLSIIKDGKYLIAISDGMGSGPEARKSSQIVIKMLQRLLNSGFEKDTSIDLINSSFSMWECQ